MAAGNVAQGLVDGLAASLTYYQKMWIGHRSLVIGFVLYPFYRFIGSYVLFIRLLNALLVIAGTVFWMVLVRRFWGSAAAAMFALWWTFPPPFVARSMHVSYVSFHLEYFFWSGLSALLLLGDHPKTSRICWSAFIAGFASFYFPENQAFSAALFVAALLRWPRRDLRHLIVCSSIFFFLGFFPDVLLSILPGQPEQSLLVYAWQSLRPIAELWQSAWLLYAPDYSIGGLTLAVSSLLFIGLLSAVFYFFVRSRRLPAEKTNDIWLVRFLALQIGLTMLAYARAHDAGPPDTPDLFFNRYLITILPPMMLLACHFLSRLPRFAGWPILMLVVVMGAHDLHPVDEITDAYRMIGDGSLGSMVANRGDDYYDFITIHLVDAWDKNRAQSHQESIRLGRDSVEKLPRNWRALGYEEFGFWVGPDEILPFLEKGDLCPASFAPDCAVGAAKAYLEPEKHLEITDPLAPETPRKIVARISLWEQTVPKLSGYFVRGLGEAWIDQVCKKTGNDCESEMTSVLREPPTQGAIPRRIRDSTSALVHLLTPAQRVEFVYGLGWWNNLHYPAPGFSLPQYLGFAGTDEEVASYQRALADSFALQAMRTCNRLAVPFIPARDPKLVRQYLLEHGITMTLVSRPNAMNYYLLERH